MRNRVNFVLLVENFPVCWIDGNLEHRSAAHVLKRTVEYWQARRRAAIRAPDGRRTCKRNTWCVFHEPKQTVLQGVIRLV